MHQNGPLPSVMHYEKVDCIENKCAQESEMLLINVLKPSKSEK